MSALSSQASGSRRRILFVTENVTLAQCVRLVTLASALDAAAYEVHFACSDFPELVFGGTRFVQHPIASLSPEAATRALEAGRRLYEKADLLRYIEAERRLIEAVEPALVVGDFRLSLSTSAELMGVPSAVLINAYWSPFARRTGFPVPDHPITRYLGEALTAKYFPRALPHVFRHFAQPLDAARAQHGLGSVGGLLEMLTHADHTLYPDDPWLTPLDGAPASHRFLGPVLWQPEWQPDLDQASPPSGYAPGLAVSSEAAPGSVALGLPASMEVASERQGSRAGWYGLDPERPRLYVTLGSSGALRLLPMVLEALARLPVVAVVATAGRVELGAVPPNVTARSFVRGTDLARDAALVIFNGGSTTGYQALSQGTKVLGLPSNFDQYLAMEAIERAGAGLSVKARQASPERICAMIERALSDPTLDAGAASVAEHFRGRDSAALFRRFVADVTGSERRPGGVPRAASLA